MKEPPLPWLSEDFDGNFPPVETALTDPEGLLAAGGTLDPSVLLKAYKQGIFPWYTEGQPILWWTPNPRCVLYPEKLKISKSLKKTLRKNTFEVRVDTVFSDIMIACAQPRKNQRGTWITPKMFNAYNLLHQQGFAKSIECWVNNKLVGGLYGVAIGKVFFGESMFSLKIDASKVALHHLCTELKPALIDVQIHSQHMETLGAELISRRTFCKSLKKYC